MKVTERARWLRDGFLASLAASARGAAAVEFALLVPVILAGLTGVANYGLAMYEKMELVSAARAGAQMAIRDRTATTSIAQIVVDSTNLSITTSDVSTSETCWCADIDATFTCGTTCADGDPSQYFMTVTVTKTFTPVILGENAALLIFGKSLTVSGSVKVRTQ